LGMEQCSGRKRNIIFFSLTSSHGQNNNIQLESHPERESTHTYHSCFTQPRAWSSEATGVPLLPPLGSETRPSCTSSTGSPVQSPLQSSLYPTLLDHGGRAQPGMLPL
jgi:hypothetical protein